MVQQISDRPQHAVRSAGRATGRASAVVVALLIVSGAAACHPPFKYTYENKTGVGLTDRATDYCQREAKKLGYAVRTANPKIVDSPSQVDIRMRVVDGGGELIASCEFDDKRRVAALPKPQRGDVKKGISGYIEGDAKQARTVCDKAVKSSGYDARKVSVAQWTGERTYRVNVEVRQGGADRNVACRFDAVPGTASVPPVTK
ncbi:MAG: hypothetical protein ABI120_03750 [Gemmatimonadaceae bacterium]